MVRGTFLGGPHNMDCSILVSIIFEIPLILGNHRPMHPKNDEILDMYNPQKTFVYICI